MKYLLFLVLAFFQVYAKMHMYVSICIAGCTILRYEMREAHSVYVHVYHYIVLVNSRQRTETLYFLNISGKYVTTIGNLSIMCKDSSDTVSSCCHRSLKRRTQKVQHVFNMYIFNRDFIERSVR